MNSLTPVIAVASTAFLLVFVSVCAFSEPGRRKRVLLIGTVFTWLLAASAILVAMRPLPARLSIAASQSGMEFVGVISVDGDEQRVHGAVPQQYELSGRKIEVMVIPLDPTTGDQLYLTYEPPYPDLSKYQAWTVRSQYGNRMSLDAGLIDFRRRGEQVFQGEWETVIDELNPLEVTDRAAIQPSQE
jgi:hypothetical protein